MPLVDRFSEYVAELHELSNTHQLPHGHPEDLVQLLEAFQKSPNFTEEFGCMMRSIALRENFRPSETELLTLVAVAWAGAEPDVSTPQFLHLLEELRTVLQKALARRVLGHRTDSPISSSTEKPEALDASSGMSETNRKFEISPGLSMPPTALDIQRHEKENSEVNGSISIETPSPSLADNSAVAPQEHRRALSTERPPFYEALEEDLRKKKGKNGALEYSPATDTGSELVPTRRFEPSMAEILAMALTGLMFALLFSAGSLPVYRSRVSIYLPSAPANSTDSGANAGASISGVTNAARGASLLNGALTEKVAERLLTWPGAKSIFRQDVVSRGMRDLDLGGNEPILYADLVAETARQVKVLHVQPQNLYVITCDSWSAQFAATFCNELTSSLEEELSNAASPQENFEPAHTIDAASRPGIQVYPHWYLQASIGLGVGGIIGLLLGFVKPSAAKSAHENNL